MVGFSHEKRLGESGFFHICGIDEAGRGPLAGPVVAAACYFEEHSLLPGLGDSKELSPTRRDELFEIIHATPSIHFGISIIDAKTIDEINILQATLRAMRGAFDALVQKIPLDFALVDGNILPQLPTQAEALIKGDGISASIAAASVLAKVTRDRLMLGYDATWPGYGFAQHKGYGTQAHKEALERLGPSPIHRLSFAPLKAKLQSH